MGFSMQFKISCFEVKKLGEDQWQEASERVVLAKLAECFDPVSPILTKMMEGNEIVAHREIYRIRC
jgi:hypothetical protein